MSSPQDSFLQQARENDTVTGQRREGDGSATPLSLGLVTVATNRYLAYWVDMVRTAEEWISGAVSIVANVLTDDPQGAAEAGRHLSRIAVNPIEIAPLGWPDATLLRYQLITEHQRRIFGDLLMHIDADSAFMSSFDARVLVEATDDVFVTVQHPGYRRPSPTMTAALYARHPKDLLRDARMKVTLGALGSWETRPQSRAFVPRAARARYVCGGVWGGTRHRVIDVCTELAERVRDDQESGITAVWHDESHLNWYSATHYTRTLGCEFCYAPDRPNLRDLTPVIVAIDKPERTR